jgi:hypothetical protein
MSKRFPYVTDMAYAISLCPCPEFHNSLHDICPGCPWERDMSTSAHVVFLDARVEIEQSRWEVIITVIDSLGGRHEYVVSADALYTEHDRIWFGTRQEMLEMDRR